MITIHKYGLFPGVDGNVKVLIPKGFKILSLQNQNNNICLWALADTNEELIEVKFIVCGTGHDCTNVQYKKYVGTVQVGVYVWHVFSD